MRVVLGTIGKFHMFDLARQLYRHRVLVKIFSGYPWNKLRQERLPRQLVDTYPWIVAPRMGLSRYNLLHGGLLQEVDELAHNSFASHVASKMPECDIFHALSRYSLRPGVAAKSRGARFVLDVGSSHMQTQLDLLNAEMAKTGIATDMPHPAAIAREFREYEEADLITVPSQFSFDSFLAHGTPRHKLAKVRYGVDLDLFKPVPVADDGVFRVVFVGALGLRKGIHYLLKAFAHARIPNGRLVLIGSRTPETERLLRGLATPNMLMTGHVPQPLLATWLSRANVFVLPSIEDGFGLVILQALACGCPVIATTNTGGPECIRDGENGFIVPPGDPEALAERLVWFAEHRPAAGAMRERALMSTRHADSVERYGDDMMEVYRGLLAGTGMSQMPVSVAAVTE